MEVTLIDSPVANVANIARALRQAGADLRVTRDAEVIAVADKIVLPGVGSFAAAMQWLREWRIDDAIRNATSRGASLLGVCVGHQLLFDLWGGCPPLFEGIADGTAFYFVNSYAVNAESEIARADYGGAFTAAAHSGRIFGVQFHPEKSSAAGIRLLRNFVKWT